MVAYGAAAGTAYVEENLRPLPYRKSKYLKETNTTLLEVDHKYVHIDNEGMYVPVATVFMHNDAIAYEIDELELTGASRLIIYHPNVSLVNVTVHRFIGDKTGQIHIRYNQEVYVEVVESESNHTEAPCSFLIDDGSEIFFPSEVHLHGTRTEMHGRVTGVHKMFIEDQADVIWTSTAQTAIKENGEYIHLSEDGNFSVPELTIKRGGQLSFLRVSNQIVVHVADFEVKYLGLVLMNDGLIDSGHADLESEGIIMLDGKGLSSGLGPGAGISESASYSDAGGGSGGSILLEATNFTGHGDIQVNGGNGLGRGSGGSGGRIGIHIDHQNDFGGRYSSVGGLAGSSHSNSFYGHGAAGTVYKFESRRGPQYRDLKYNDPARNLTTIKPEHSKLKVDNGPIDVDHPVMVMEENIVFYEFDEVQVEGYSYVHFYHPADAHNVTVVIHELTGNKKGLIRVLNRQRLFVNVVESTHTYLDAPCGFHVDWGGELVLPTTVIMLVEVFIMEGRLTGVEELIIERNGEVQFIGKAFTDTLEEMLWHEDVPYDSGRAGWVEIPKIIVNNRGELALKLTSQTKHKLDAGELVVRKGGLINVDIPTCYINTGDFTIERGGKVTAAGMGYSKNQGPGRGRGISGAGHGSVGGGNSHEAGDYYGHLLTPSLPGSGGGGSYGGAGGGYLHILVGKTLTCDGVISVDGSDAGSSFPGAGGGSGGSVQIHTSHHRGRGQIHAHGGDCSFYNVDSPGGGSGGRIAIYQREARHFLGDVTAFGGYCQNGNYGGPGSIVTSVITGQEEQRFLVIDNQNRNNGENCFHPVELTTSEDYQLEDVYLKRRACLSIVSAGNSRQVNIGHQSGDGTGQLVISNRANVFIGSKDKRTRLASRLLVGIDAKCQVAPLVLLTRTTWLHGAFFGSDKFVVDANLYLYESGYSNCLNCSADSSDRDAGPGRGRKKSAGGSYGGMGWGNDFDDRPVYGQRCMPTMVGSGGAGCRRQREGGTGGGAVKFVAENLLIMEGSVDVDGVEGDEGAGGGSGGAIWLDGGTMEGRGSLFARGGDSENHLFCQPDIAWIPLMNVYATTGKGVEFYLDGVLLIPEGSDSNGLFTDYIGPGGINIQIDIDSNRTLPSNDDIPIYANDTGPLIVVLNVKSERNITDLLDIPDHLDLLDRLNLLYRLNLLNLPDTPDHLNFLILLYRLDLLDLPEIPDRPNLLDFLTHLHQLDLLDLPDVLEIPYIPDLPDIPGLLDLLTLFYRLDLLDLPANPDHPDNQNLPKDPDLLDLFNLLDRLNVLKLTGIRDLPGISQSPDLLELLNLLDLLGLLDLPDIPEVPDLPTFPEDPGLLDLLNFLNHLGLLDLPDIPDFPEDPVLPEDPGLIDLLNFLNGLGLLDLPEIPDLPDIPDNPGLIDLLNLLDQLGIIDLPDSPGVPDIPDNPGLQDILNLLDQLGLIDLPDIPDNPDLPDIPDLPNIPDFPDNLGLLDLLNLLDQLGIIDIPDIPKDPGFLDILKLLNQLGLIDLPDIPDNPDLPDIPDLPVIPTDPGLLDLLNLLDYLGLIDLPDFPDPIDPPNIPDEPGLLDLVRLLDRLGLIDLPEIPANPGVPGIPDDPGLMDILNLLDKIGLINLPDIPAIPDLPEIPDDPSLLQQVVYLLDLLDQLGVIDIPDIPDDLDLPEMPDDPNLLDILTYLLDILDQLGVIDIPDIPDNPDLPEMPDDPGIFEV
ncbi:Tenascin-X [Apostichopus japonicus]|uniref:Tenascin-X n=1 Tax=Stichopus japonicus TaxID=307972 RepID=A0A2G8L4J0_STIJA|nr:Tenascin-X [Apostichopus japonicus]